MNTCEGYEDLISAFLDGMLSDGDRLALMEHMAHCSVCQDYFNGQIAIHDAVMDDMESMQIPDNFTDAVMERVRTTPQEKKKRALHWRQWTALAACCVLTVLGAWRIGWNWTEHVNAAGIQEVSEEAEDSTADMARAEGANVVSGDTDVPVPQMTEKSAPTMQQRSGGTFSQSARDAETFPQPETPDSTVPAEDAGNLEPAEAAPSLGIVLYQYNGTESLAPGLDTAYAGILTTASPLAAEWLAENLDGVWVSGGCYEMNAEEYQALKEILSANGAVFSETAGPAGSEGFLLIASDMEEP